jgi:hypothetical protein
VFSCGQDAVTSGKHWWERSKEAATEKAAEIADAEGARWSDLSARTAAAVLDARDAAERYADAALKSAGIRDKSKTEQAKEKVEEVTHRLLVALGLQEVHNYNCAFYC